MGKSGDLWDDSALLKAFDGAVSKYKMHGLSGVTEGEIVDNNTEEKLPTAEADNGSSGLVDNNAEHVKKDDDKIEETANNLHLLQIKDTSSLEIENHAMESHNVQSQNEAAWGSVNQDEYNQLLSKYYEIEDQRQKILQQLNQCNNWNYQNPIADTSTSEEYYRASLPQQTYDTVTCYCSYGCQNWVVPCDSLTASCSDARKPHSVSHEESDDIVKIAMDSAKRAVSSITQDASIKADASANEGNSVEITAQSTESSKTETDLAAVLNAWYSAGFYTGKYLSEQQSVEKKIKRGNGL